jgi:hypothetical protein
MTEESWFDSRQGEVFSFLPDIQTGSGAHPAFIHSVHVALLSGIKRTGRENDNLHLFNTVVKTAWSCTSSPTYAFVAYKRTTLLLLLPLNTFQYHFKGDSYKIQKNSTRREESRAQHCHRPEIIYAVSIDTPDLVLTVKNPTRCNIVSRFYYSLF